MGRGVGGRKWGGGEEGERGTGKGGWGKGGGSAIIMQPTNTPNARARPLLLEGVGRSGGGSFLHRASARAIF